MNKNSKMNIIQEYYEKNSSPLINSTSVKNEKVVIDYDDIRNFFIEKKTGQYIIKKGV